MPHDRRHRQHPSDDSVELTAPAQSSPGKRPLTTRLAASSPRPPIQRKSASSARSSRSTAGDWAQSAGLFGPFRSREGTATAKSHGARELAGRGSSDALSHSDIVQAKAMGASVLTQELVQRKSSDHGAQADTGSPSAGGTGMPDAVQRKMESAFGSDFSDVRVVADSPRAADVGAVAFAQGNDIHFASGQYQPNTTGGQELLGHELAHVVQQRNGRVSPTMQAKGGGVAINDSPALEHEADEAGARAARGEPVDVAGRGSDSLQLKRYNPSDRIDFTFNDQKFSGVVVKVKTDSENDKEVVYEVDSNMDGDQQSLLVKNGKAIKVESPNTPDIDPKSIKTILGMPVKKLDKKFIKSNETARKSGGGVIGAAEGDVMVGHGILIKKKNVEVSKKPTREELSKQNFQGNVLVDLATIATTKSGQMLLGSIESAAKTSGKVVLIDWVDGQISRSNAGQLGSGGTWDTSNEKAGKPANSNVGYNPSILGLPMSVGPSHPMMETQDEIVWPALEDEFGRPKEKPSDVSLFHELVHADDILHGRLYTQEVPSGNFDRSKVSEMHAVGLEEYYDDDFISGKTEFPTIYSENTYRHERGVALRPWYKDEQETEEYVSDYTGKEDEEDLQPVPKDLTFKALRFKKTIREHQKQVSRVEKENKRRTNKNAEIRRAKDRNAHDTPEIRDNRRALLEDVKKSNAAVTPKSDKKSKKSKKKSSGSLKKPSKSKDSNKSSKNNKKNGKRREKPLLSLDKPRKPSGQVYPVFGLPEKERRIYTTDEIAKRYQLFKTALEEGTDDNEELYEAIDRFTTHLDWQVAEMQPDRGLRSDYVDHANFHLPRDPESSSFNSMIASQGKDNVEAYNVFVWFTKFTDLM